MAMAAELEWMAAASAAPAAMPHSGLRPACSRNQENSPLSRKYGTMPCMMRMPSRMPQKPAAARESPPAAAASFGAFRSGEPGMRTARCTAMQAHRAGKKAPSSIFSPISSVVRHVPMLAPRMMPSDRGKVRTPAFTMPTVRTVTALELCRAAAATVPVRSPRSGVRVRRASIVFIHSPVHA